MENFSQNTENKEKEVERVVFQVVFSLLLAFLGPLEGSAVKKCTECRCSTLVCKQMTP